MDEYQREVIEGIMQIKKLQEDLTRTAEKQIELLERLVELEHAAGDFKQSIVRMNKRLEILEEEVSSWKVMRKLVSWLGPAGLVGILGALFLISQGKL